MYIFEKCQKKKMPPSTPQIKILSQESPKRGIPPIFKNEIQALNKFLKILIGVSLYIILHDKKMALKRSVSVIGSADTAFCDRPQKSWSEHH